MITTSKPVATNDVKILQKLFFLTKDGESQPEEEFLVNDSLSYVSKNDSDKYGKVEQYNTGDVYYLKQFRGGRPGELLVDPYGMFAKPEDLSAFTTQRGHRFCEYVRVSEQVFKAYVTYLKTRDPRIFRYCEKVILDNVL